MAGEDHDELLDNNLEAEANYESNPEGRDEFAEPLEATLWL